MSNLDALTTMAREQLYHRLLALFDTARANLDRDAIAAALANAGDLAALDEALGFIPGTLEALAKANKEDDQAYVGDAITLPFLAMVAAAAVSIGHSDPTNASRAKIADDLAQAFATKFLADSAEAVRSTAQRMLTASGTIESRVAQIIRVVGLSPAQARSLDATRAALLEYVATPPTKGTRPATRPLSPAAIVAKRHPVLSGPQRAMLIKAMEPDLTPQRVERLLDRHASSLAEYRARITANETAHNLAERAKLTAWTEAQHAGVLPPDQRRIWQTAGDERVRHTHAQVPGMNPGGVPLDKPFQTPLGECMAPPLEINCRCKAVLAGTR